MNISKVPNIIKNLLIVLKKKISSVKYENTCPTDEEVERSKEVFKEFDIEIGEEITRLYLKSDELSLACVFDKFVRVPINEFGINPLYCVSLSGYFWNLV